MRKASEGKHEIISGHRRKCACKKSGIETIPTVAAELDGDQAAIEKLVMRDCYSGRYMA